MDSMKENPTVVSVSEQHKGGILDHAAEKELNEPEISAAIPAQYRGRENDRRDMNMLGKK